MMPKRLRACGSPRGPNMRMRLFGCVPVASPSFSKPYRRLDVVAQDRLAIVDIAGEHGVDAFAQQRFAEGGIPCDPLHQLLETPRQRHRLPPRRGNSVAQAPALHKRYLIASAVRLYCPSTQQIAVALAHGSRANYPSFVGSHPYRTRAFTPSECHNCSTTAGYDAI